MYTISLRETSLTSQDHTLRLVFLIFKRRAWLVRYGNRYVLIFLSHLFKNHCYLFNRKGVVSVLNWPPGSGWADQLAWRVVSYTSRRHDAVSGRSETISGETRPCGGGGGAEGAVTASRESVRDARIMCI